MQFKITKKNFRTILFLFIIQFHLNTIAQNILVPYKSGKKFGLSDEFGKIMLQPQFDDISYLGQHYFSFTNFIFKKDTFKNYSGGIQIEERVIKQTGILLNDKVLIPMQSEFEFFIIDSNFIFASQNSIRPEKCLVFNKKGEKIINNTIRNVSINEFNEVGNLGNSTSDYSFIFTQEYSQIEYQNNLSLGLYNNKEQRIEKWFVKNASTYDLNKSYIGNSFISIKYTDSIGNHDEIIRYKNNQFIKLSKEKLTNIDKQELEKGLITDFNTVVMDEKVVPDDYEAYLQNTIMPIEEDTKNPNINSNETRYLIKKDSLFFIVKNKRNFIKLDKSIKLIPTQVIKKKTGNIVLRKSILFNDNNKYGIINNGKLSKAIFDSLRYCICYRDTESYLAFTKTDGGLKYGLINRDEQVIIPFEYDSIKSTIINLNLVDDDENKNKLIIEEPKDKFQQNDNTTFRFNENSLFYKNGKVGIVSFSNKKIIDVNYDLIIKNTIPFTDDKVWEYYILKKDGLYGIIDFKFDNNQTKPNNPTKPMFEFYPIYYFNNYYEMSGLRLFALYDDKFEFVGFANENGIKYYKR